jgi:D-alanyl-lipoteichoic acid acyltransferase DltB (MBOAT superfamily)
MLLGGFWHGASWNFIIWGALHGSVLGVHKYFTSFDFYINWHFSKSKTYAILSGILTFHFVCFCWIFFRAETLEEAQLVIHQILHNFTWVGVEKFVDNYKNVLLMMTLGYVLHLIPSKFSFNEWKWVKEKPVFFYVLFFILFLIAYSQLKSAESVMPIYLQF